MSHEVARSHPWENGSEFHLWEQPLPVTYPKAPWCNGEYLGSGRDALRHLLGYGKREFGWHSVWIPAYFCPEVVEAVLKEGFRVYRYEELPTSAFREPRPGTSGEVLFVCNTFGVRQQPSYSEAWTAIIEDHTHDPWSSWAYSSVACYGVASLRKTLPVPDGAVVWSPRHLHVPNSPRQSRVAASGEKLAAMALKAMYLKGVPVSKGTFRRLFARGEASIAAGAVYGMSEYSASVVKVLPWREWRERRRLNFDVLISALGDHYEILRPTSPGACPFSAMLVSQSDCESLALQEHLISQCIYPARLWPMQDERWCMREATQLSARMLSIHCDFRYDSSDMLRVADAVLACSRRERCH